MKDEEKININKIQDLSLDILSSLVNRGIILSDFERDSIYTILKLCYEIIEMEEKR